MRAQTFSSFAPMSASMRGFTLLEVLVAVVVLAIGILGLVGLQTSSLKQNQNAMARTIATEYANAIVDKMRSNPREAALGYYNVRPDGAAVPNVPPESQAGKDVKLWQDNLKKALPAAQVQVCRAKGETAGATTCGTEGDYYMVCIRWDQAGGGSNKDPLFEANTQQFYLAGRI
ncbi:MAG: type IV pilus modification protein PilV [Zoogloeaceae bacterium]|jgi:type IV pilus assembly protein PilV|nr:type IV pilus modification protein PilV [Zoogloeaceae bacterium]